MLPEGDKVGAIDQVRREVCITLGHIESQFLKVRPSGITDPCFSTVAFTDILIG
jgi:hypothetical protein